MAAKTAASLDVGRRLRGLREERGIPKELVALTLGMSAENLRHYESGRNQLAVTQLPALANLFKMTLPELVSGLFDGAPERSNPNTTTHGDDGLNTGHSRLYIETDRRALRMPSPRVRELAFA